MTDAESSPLTLGTGTHGDYQWITSEQALDVLLQRCPQVVLGKYLAVTSLDSGFLTVNEALKLAGWKRPKDIGYSPQIRSLQGLPRGGYDEWYVFDAPVDLGDVIQGNVFEASLQPRQVAVFVNYDGPGLHDAEKQDLVDLFWSQMELINPLSYLADCGSHLTFISRDKELFANVRRALGDPIG